MVAHKYQNPLDPPYKAPETNPSPEPANTSNTMMSDSRKVIADAISTSTVTPEFIVTPTPTPNANTPASTIPTDSDIAALGDLINSLAPAELAKLRIIAKQVAPEIAEAAGIDSNIRKLANGMIEAKIILSPDVIEMISPWCENSGRTLGEEIQEVAEVSITSYLSMDWGSVQPVVTGGVTPPVAPVTPSATTVPPAAVK